MIVQPTDSPDEISATNRVNDLEKDIKDFQRFKVEIERIYLNSKDDGEIESKLLDLFKRMNSNDPAAVKPFIDAVKKDKSNRIEFPNVPLEIWASLAKKKREIQKEEKQIDKLKTEIETETANTDPDTSELSKQEIASDTEKLKNKEKKIDELEIDVQKLQKNATDKLNLMKKEFQKGLSDINKDRQQDKTLSTGETE